MAWWNRECKADVRCTNMSDETTVVSCVYRIGQYDVTIPGEEKGVTYRVRDRASDPKSSFPSMEIEDGRIIIGIEDLTEQVLARAEPIEIAKALWQDKDVRREFLECLAQRWNEQGFGDDDRRAFIALVKEQVHSKRLDLLVDKLGGLEYAFSQKWRYFQEIDRLNQTLSAYDCRYSDGKQIRFHRPDEDDQFRICGAVWQEARDAWREEVRAMFSPVPTPNGEGQKDYQVCDDLASAADPAQAIADEEARDQPQGF